MPCSSLKHPYGVHMHLPVEPEHFLRWMTLFEDHPVQVLLNQHGKLCRESFGCPARARKIGSGDDVILGCKRDPEQAANASA